jgi:hypothetical protein
MPLDSEGKRILSRAESVVINTDFEKLSRWLTELSNEPTDKSFGIPKPLLDPHALIERWSAKELELHLNVRIRPYFPGAETSDFCVWLEKCSANARDCAGHNTVTRVRHLTPSGLGQAPQWLDCRFPALYG